MKKVFPTLLLFMVLVGCNKQGGLPSSEPSVTSYPAPLEIGVGNGYPIHSVESTEEGKKQNKPFLVDTPTKGNGNVTGVLNLKGSPVKEINLFLAGFVQDSSGNDAVAYISPGKSPETTTDDQGNFTFYNVPVGNYGIVLEYISDTFILLTPDGSTTLMVNVEDQKTTNLGLLDYDDLPIK